jgi:protein-S-isoprenylcysteine O-methyltransferase Ste14
MAGRGEPKVETTTSWRWDNVPLPEPHMAGIILSAALHLARPCRLPGSSRLYSSIGWTLVGVGVAISASAVRAASDADLERPTTLVSTGPYAISRNPMYVGWTLLYVGVALITRNSWMLFSLPLIGGIIHREVLGEERALERAFGDEYVEYRRLVRRYVW